MVQDLSMVRGDTFMLDVDITGITGTISAAYFTCRTDFNGTQLFQKSLSSGIEAIDEDTVRLTISPADTSSLSYGTYVYDFKVTASSAVCTVLTGVFNLEPDVKDTGSSSASEDSIYGGIITDTWG